MNFAWKETGEYLTTKLLTRKKFWVGLHVLKYFRTIVSTLLGLIGRRFFRNLLY